MASEAFLNKDAYPNVPVVANDVNTPWDFIAWAQANGNQKFGTFLTFSQLYR